MWVRRLLQIEDRMRAHLVAAGQEREEENALGRMQHARCLQSVTHSSHCTKSAPNPIRLLTPPTSLLLGHASTAGAEVGTVAKVDPAQIQTRGRRRWGRVARRARAEGPLERVLQPGDVFQAESGEACDLRPAPGLATFRGSVVYMSCEKNGEGESGQAVACQMMDGGSRCLFTRGVLVNAVCRRAPVLLRGRRPAQAGGAGIVCRVPF